MPDIICTKIELALAMENQQRCCFLLRSVLVTTVKCTERGGGWRMAALQVEEESRVAAGKLKCIVMYSGSQN
jgi:hypothetical protein